MDLLRKKVTSLEERLTGKSEVEREKDGEFVKNRKLVKLVEKYKCELNEAHVEIRDLKARLLRTSEIQVYAYNCYCNCGDENFYRQRNGSRVWNLFKLGQFKLLIN